MELLFLIAIGLGLYLLLRPNKSVDTAQQLSVEEQLESRNVEWATFIARYYEKAQTKAAKQLIEQMIDDIAAKGLPAPVLPGRPAPKGTQKLAAQTVNTPVVTSVPLPDQDVNAEPEWTPVNTSVQIDNATLLLYFGAFLFVASVGLFVAFAGFSGVTRTIAVLLAVMVMYASGIWLHNNKPKLEQAGLAFAGIGLASAPFVGLAAYNFVFDQSTGSIVWLVTSLGCLALYTHALVVLKKPLLNYVLLFTFLSLIQSGISVVNAPVYYFGWGLAAIGIMYALFARSRYADNALADASAQSARLFLPISVFASLLFVDSEGLLQLSVSLVFAAAYYAIEFWFAQTDEAREQYAVVTHALSLLAVGIVTYDVSASYSAVGYVLGILSVVSVTAIALVRRLTPLWYNFASMALVSGVAGIIFTLSSSRDVMVTTLFFILTSVGVWVLQKRTDAFVCASIAWIALPLIIGQGVLDPAMSAGLQALLMAAAATVQWAIVYAVRDSYGDEWRPTALVLYLVNAAGIIGATIIAGNNFVLLASGVIAISIITLAERSNAAEWTSAAGLIIAVPALVWEGQSAWIVWNAVIALGANILIALKYRQESSRWLSAGLWLLLPLSANHGLQLDLGPAGMAWFYFVIGLCLVLSRAIARGVVFASSRIPLSAYARSASMSYVVGYAIALGAALLLSLNDVDSVLHTTALLALGTGLLALLAWYVEKQVDLWAVLPVMLQSILLSALRPSSDSEIDVYLILSTVLALVTYAVGAVLSTDRERLSTMLKGGSVLTAAVTPASYFVVGESYIMMPIGLFVLSGLLYAYQRTITQSGREWIGGLALLSVWWLMAIAGITNIQAYTHVLAALFAVYAVRRAQLLDETVSDQYIIAALGTSTVPLILQALGGTAGDIYGWWLLLEQVAFMLIGMSINKPLITKWGLYVALGAVLYQLRNLGWAALIVLALFIIGVAVYKLQTTDRSE